MYAAKKGYRKPSIKNPRNEYLWTVEMVRKILMNQSYINFKTYSSREPRHAIRDQIMELSPSFIARVFASVSKLFNSICLIHKKRQRELSVDCKLPKNSDCGANLNYKYTHDNPGNHYFSCNNRAGNGLCKKTHHVR